MHKHISNEFQFTAPYFNLALLSPSGCQGPTGSLKTYVKTYNLLKYGKYKKEV